MNSLVWGKKKTLIEVEFDDTQNARNTFILYDLDVELIVEFHFFLTQDCPMLDMHGIRTHQESISGTYIKG